MMDRVMVLAVAGTDPSLVHLPGLEAAGLELWTSWTGSGLQLWT